MVVTVDAADVKGKKEKRKRLTGGCGWLTHAVVVVVDAGGWWPSTRVVVVVTVDAADVKENKKKKKKREKDLPEGVGG